MAMLLQFRTPLPFAADKVMSELRAIVDFQTASADRSESSPAADRLIEGSPRQIIENFFSDSTGHFHCGIWTSTPGCWRVKYSENEFCHVTEGRVRISDAYGRSKEFGPGASFVIPAGFEGQWHVLEPMRKFYAIFEAG